MHNIKKFFQLAYNRYRYPELVEKRPPDFSKEKLSLVGQIFAHPIRVFGDIKYEKQGSLIIANALAFLYFATQVFIYFVTGYIFSNNEASDFSLATTIVSSLGILFLWAICNWVTGTLLEGESTFREIWIASCYATLPYIVIQGIATAVSPVLVLSEATMFSTFLAVGQIWMLALLFLGMMTMQQFTVLRAIVSTLITVFLMLAVVFLILLFFSIFQQMTSFVTTVISELRR